MKLPCLVQRNPGVRGEYPAGTIGNATHFHSARTDDLVRYYWVTLGNGEQAVWSDEHFHEVQPRPLQDVVQNVEDSNVTSSRGGGLKFDEGKPQPRLLHEGLPRALAEVVGTLTFGAGKYEAHSWQKVENAMARYQDASYRHDAKRCQGELIDAESGLHHRAHHIINELFLLELELRNKETA